MSRPHPLFGDASVREVSVAAATVWRSPDSPRHIDEPALRDEPDVAAWADAMDTEARVGLHGRTETQVLLGEGVQVMEERDGWSRVAALFQASSQLEAGYPGWVRTAHLGEAVPVWRGAHATVVSREATCHVDGADTTLSFGTALWVDSLGETTAVLRLPGGRLGEVDLDDLRLGHKRQQPVYGEDDVLGTAEQFLGLRYLWGGTSTWGVDCSGLVHLVMRSFGVRLPRDAHDQATADNVDPVPLDQVQPGDLYFFARPGQRPYHVGFVSGSDQSDGRRWMLHAPESGDPHVEDCPIAPQRLETLVSAGRVRKPWTGRELRRSDVASPRSGSR